MIRISHSRIRLWRRCRRAYFYRYVENLVPRSVIRPLVFGKTVHKIIEFQLEGKTQEQAIFEASKEKREIISAELDDWEGIVRDANDIMLAYQKFWQSDKVKVKKIKGKAAEHKFEFELTKGILLVGVIDVFPETADGRIWIGEHKSHKSIPTEDVRMRDLQTMIYAYIAPKAFPIKRIAGVMWDYIRSKSPTRPELLKNGTLSKRRIDTLPQVYEKAIIANGLSVNDYVDILGDLDDKLGSWFKRVYLPINKTATEQMIEETIHTSREIRAKAGVDVTRNISRDCSFCSYERLCRADLFDLDTDFIREREYKERTEYVETQDDDASSSE